MERIYNFDTGSHDMSAWVASMMNNMGNNNLATMLAAASKNQDAWGGSGMWFIWVILMFWLWGGNSNFGGRNGIANELNNDFGRATLLEAIKGNGTSIAQLATTLNCDVNSLREALCNVQSSIQGLSGQLGMSSQQIINAIQTGDSAINAQLVQCCCTIQDSITRQGYENRIAITDQTNTLQGTMNCNNQAILAKLDAMQTQGLYDKIDALREKNSALMSQLSNEHQTAAIQAYQAQSLIPISSALQDLSSRLGAIECKQPNTVTIPYIPAMSNLVPVSYSQPVSFGFGYGSTYGTCGC